MPSGSLVVLAGRRKPDAEWFQGGWEQVCVELELRPFADDEARALGRQHGVDDDETLERAARVGRGLAARADARRRRRARRRLARPSGSRARPT